MEDVSLLSLFGRLVISLAVVLVLMALLAKVMRKRMVPGTGRRKRPGQLIEVVARQQLGRNASIALVRVGASELLVGVTDQQVNLITETDSVVLEDQGTDWTPYPGGAPAGVTPSQAWRDVVERLRERTVRRS
ncbi:MAG TPA: flagellar biosynthetic protein FliO [Acidimicrobiia bacterium]|nr:flagellar biosynthetic protein FliO [Acidimicrobiia bacterium]